jgi:hypothetical protein
MGVSTPALVGGAANADHRSTGWRPSEPRHQNGLARAGVRLKKDLLCERRPTRFAATRFLVCWSISSVDHEALPPNTTV